MIRPRLLAPFLIASALQVAVPNFALAQTTQVSADENARARELFRQGAAAMKEGKFQDARKALQQVWTIRQSYDVAAILGQVELELKAYRDAAEHLDFALRNLAPRESAETLANIKTGLASAKQRVGELRITVNEAGVPLTLDEKDLGSSPLPTSIFVEPGSHVVKAHGRFDRVASQTIQAAAGSAYAVELTLAAEKASTPTVPSSGLGEPSLPPPRSEDAHEGPSMVPVVVGGSIALVGLGLGVGYRVAASSALDDLQALKEKNGASGCNTGAAASADCDAARSAGESVDFRRNISTASFVVAGAALVGTAMYWLWPRSAAESAAGRRRTFSVSGAPAPQGGSLFVSGSF